MAVVVASVVAVAEGDVERAWACSSPPSSVAASSSVSSKGLSGESKVRRGGDGRRREEGRGKLSMNKTEFSYSK